MRPKVFVASSSETLNIAKSVQVLLEPTADVKIWTQGVFEPGENTLDSLIEAIQQHDFAIIVFSGDDTVISKDITRNAPRDDIIFESGLFIGHFGKKSVYLLVDEESDPKIPTDLLGTNYVKFRRRDDGNIDDAIGASVTKIEQKMMKMFSRPNVKKVQNSNPYPTIYWSAPHNLAKKNGESQSFLVSHGIKVLIPYDIVREQSSIDLHNNQDLVRTVCIDALEKSDFVVVDLDSYGLDSAWEIGFAEARGIPIIGLSRDHIGIGEQRNVNIRLYEDNWMHGWKTYPIFRSLEETEDHCRGKKVCILGPFDNESSFSLIRSSNLKYVSEELFLPKDIVNIPINFPKEYPWESREHAIRLIDRCDVALVTLPKYGMDTSWQIGYATYKNKEILGVIFEEEEESIEKQQVWDHWMHGWKEKIIAQSRTDLVGIIKGVYSMNIIQKKGDSFEEKIA